MQIRTVLTLAAVVEGVVSTMTGCPWSTQGEQSSAGAEDDVASIRSDAAAGHASASVEEANARATAARFPPVPSLETLCMLRPGTTTFDDAKKLLPGTPQNESMDKANASLSYRFSQRSSDEDAGTGSAALSDTSVSLFLAFKWDEGWAIPAGPVFGSVRAPAYVLSETSISGLPFPSCWRD